MAATIPGLSTLGVLFGYAVETTAGTKPATFKLLERCNAITGISIEPEQIDASALEDTVTKNVAGRSDTGGSFTATFNLTSETQTELDTMLSAFANRATGMSMWFEVYHPDMTDAYFIVAQPPTILPMPEYSQNDLLTVEIPFVIQDFKGLDTAITPTL